MATTSEWMGSTIAEIALLSDIELNDSATEIRSKDELKTKLTEIIAYLLDNNFEKLLWILYRIDIDEEKAKALLAKSLPGDAPSVLADLIILRQLKKEELKQEMLKTQQATDDDDDLRL